MWLRTVVRSDRRRHARIPGDVESTGNGTRFAANRQLCLFLADIRGRIFKVVGNWQKVSEIVSFVDLIFIMLQLFCHCGCMVIWG